MEPSVTEPVTVESPDLSLWRPRLGRGLRWLAFAAGLAPVAIMLVGGGIFGMARPAAWSGIVAAALWTAALSGLASLVCSRPFAKRAARVRADGTRIEWTQFTPTKERVRSIANGEVRQAAIVADPQTPGIALDLSGGRSMSVRTRSVEEAQRLLAALGPAARQARYRTRLHPSSVAAAGGCVTVVVAFLAGGGLWNLVKAGMPSAVAGWLWLGGIVATLFLFFVLTSRPTIEVGADGLVVREMFRSRFVSFRDLESVRAADGRVEMRFSNGRVERVRMSQVSREQLAALDDRLSRAHAIARGGDADGGRASALGRKGRSVAEWRERLSGLLRRGEGYRDAALTREEAEAVLAAGDALPEHRLGAALALAAADPERAKERVRVAADGCANPRLRVALTEIAEGELDEAAALEAIGEESGAAARTGRQLE